MTRQNGALLRINIPITEVLQRNPAPGHSTGDEPARLQHLEIIVEVAQPGFAGEGTWGESVHGAYMHALTGEVKALA